MNNFDKTNFAQEAFREALTYVVEMMQKQLNEKRLTGDKNWD